MPESSHSRSGGRARQDRRDDNQETRPRGERSNNGQRRRRQSAPDTGQQERFRYYYRRVVDSRSGMSTEVMSLVESGRQASNESGFNIQGSDRVDSHARSAEHATRDELVPSATRRTLFQSNQDLRIDLPDGSGSRRDLQMEMAFEAENARAARANDEFPDSKGSEPGHPDQVARESPQSNSTRSAPAIRADKQAMAEPKTPENQIHTKPELDGINAKAPVFPREE